MGTLEIICHNCGAIYEVQSDGVVHLEAIGANHHPYRCPHCLTKIPSRLWDKLVDAFWTLEEVNKDLRTWHTEYEDHALTQVQYKTHYVDPKKIRL